MNILSLDGVSKTLLAVPLWKNVSLGIEEGEHIGLVGRNGAGKSTFLKILTGEVVPDEGTIAGKKNLRISMLPQLPKAPSGISLRDFLYLSNAPLASLCKEYQAILDNNKADSHDGEVLFQKMEKEGGFNFERSYASLCSEFGLPDISTSMDGMSGGMIKKAAMARCLAENADLVLFDEPTNHLDINTIELLEKKLLDAKFAFILVTHDRMFLNSVSHRILEIDRSAIYSYPGDYSTYLEMKNERYNAMEKEENRRQAILKIEMKWLMRGARARATKSERRKENIKSMQAKKLEMPEPMLAFSSKSRRLGKRILELKEVQKSYNGKAVFEPFSYDFIKGDRIGVTGPNGCGKTTLLNILCGRIQADSGEVIKGANTVCSYYTQTALELPQDETMIDFIRSHAELIDTGNSVKLDPERLLEKFSFERTMQQQKLWSLSGGELRRLQLVAVLAENPNLLILDEPTNDLDIETIELLESYVDDFDGCVIAVSHDRAFLDGTTKMTIAFSDGKVLLYPGSYSAYRQYLDNEEELSKQEETKKSNAKKISSSEAINVSKSENKRKVTWKEQKEYETIIDEISLLETEKAKLEALFSSGTNAVEISEANKKYEDICAKIDERTKRWEFLAELIDG